MQPKDFLEILCATLNNEYVALSASCYIVTNFTFNSLSSALPIYRLSHFDIQFSMHPRFLTRLIQSTQFSCLVLLPPLSLILSTHTIASRKSEHDVTLHPRSSRKTAPDPGELHTLYTPTAHILSCILPVSSTCTDMVKVLSSLRGILVTTPVWWSSTSRFRSIFSRSYSSPWQPSRIDAICELFTIIKTLFTYMWSFFAIHHLSFTLILHTRAVRSYFPETTLVTSVLTEALLHNLVQVSTS